MDEKQYGFGLPIDISAHGHQIDQLIIIIHVFMAVLFVGWLAFFIYVLVRFRQRPGKKAEYHTKHFKAPTYLEAGIALTEIVLLFAFSIPIWNFAKYFLPKSENALQVRVVAEQFAWNIHYPGADGVFGKTAPTLMNASNPLGLDPDDPFSKDDITTINAMHVPTNQPVVVELTSKDVIHSFAVPVMRVKQDAIPGQKVPVWFEAKKTGNFEIACAQLCGLGHYRMRGYFISEEPQAFNAWLAQEAANKGVV